MLVNTVDGFFYVLFAFFNFSISSIKCKFEVVVSFGIACLSFKLEFIETQQ